MLIFPSDAEQPTALSRLSDYCRFARAIEVYDRACLDGDYELDGWARGGDVCAEALKRRVEQVTGLPFAFELAVA